MALRRETLDAVGGLKSLVGYLADDNQRGRAVSKLGKQLILAAGLTGTTVPEKQLGELFAHELRWGRTMRAIEPMNFALSVFQYPIIWSAVSALSIRLPLWAASLIVMAVWATRWITITRLEQALGIKHRVPPWILPPRELMSVAFLIASYFGTTVRWRGRMLLLRRCREIGKVVTLRNA